MKKYTLLFILIVLLSSCGVKYQYVPYFTDLPKDALTEEKVTNLAPLKVKPNDILAITISSGSTDPDAIAAAAVFNIGTTSSVQGENNSNLLTAINGFIVDPDGNIQIPLIGDVHVAGLTFAEIRALIKQRLMKPKQYLKDPVINLRLTNFKVSITGEVARPGVYPVNDERITLTEALSLAGDLKITALRKDVLLIREIDGQRKYVRFNLQSKDLFNSPYYYLQNNDEIYVIPDKTAYSSVDNSYRNAGLILSVISILSIFLVRL